MVVNEDLPKSRKLAKSVGSAHYFTGKPCREGHMSKRLTNSCHCTECLRIKASFSYHETKSRKREKRNAAARARYQEDIENQRSKIAASKRKRREDNRELALERERLERAMNPTRSRDAMRRWREANPERSRESSRLASAKRRMTTHGKLNARVSSAIRKSLTKGTKAGRHWEALVGYSTDDLIRHLESRFEKGMTWANYGRWEIDHIIPLSVHHFNDPEDLDFRKAWALANLQPLWMADNRSKGARLSRPFQPSLMLKAANDNTPTAGATNAAA